MKTVVAVALASVIATIIVPGQVLQMQRDDLALHQLVTCHLVHWSYEQLAWDALAFLALGVTSARRNRGAAHATLLASALLIPLAVLAFAPQVGAYRGLSGLASAMFALLLTLEWRRLTWPVIAFAILFVIKLGFEAVTGGAVFANDMGEGVVSVPVAHLAGALIGVIGGLPRRGKLLLLAPLLLASCISARPQLPQLGVNGAMCKSADLTGEWTDRRSTQLGPAWVKLVLRPDCSFTMRMQLLLARIVENGVYRVEANRIDFDRKRTWAFVREDDELRLEEAPGEWHTFKLSPVRRSWKRPKWHIVTR